MVRQLPRLDLRKAGTRLAAIRGYEFAAGRKDALGLGPFGRGRHAAPNRMQHGTLLTLAQPRYAGQKTPGIGMARIFEDIPDSPAFHHLTGVHHA